MPAKLGLDGLGDKIEGKAKEVYGKVSGDTKTEIEGKLQQAAGEGKETVSDAIDHAEDAIDDAEDAIDGK